MLREPISYEEVSNVNIMLDVCKYLYQSVEQFILSKNICCKLNTSAQTQESFWDLVTDGTSLID